MKEGGMSMIGSDKFKASVKMYNHPRHESISVLALNLNAAKIIFDLIDAGNLYWIFRTKRDKTNRLMIKISKEGKY